MIGDILTELHEVKYKVGRLKAELRSYLLDATQPRELVEQYAELLNSERGMRYTRSQAVERGVSYIEKGADAERIKAILQEWWSNKQAGWLAK